MSAAKQGGVCRVRIADWTRDQDTLRAIRSQVFIDEQKVPPELEWDGEDAGCVQLLVEDAQGRPVGTGRMFPHGKIGRMAVLREARGQGVGALLMHRFISLAGERGLQELVLDAQTHAIPFYEKFGFVAGGEEFMDAGIPHRRMWRRAPAATVAPPTR
ncbi:MAG: GNAT family N-acetyltransferase [Pseudomonadota bacterium]